MKLHTKSLRFNHNPLNLILGARRKQGLRIGYMEAALNGFYLNCIKTGVHPQQLAQLLSEKFHCISVSHQRRKQVFIRYHAPLFALYRELTAV